MRRRLYAAIAVAVLGLAMPGSAEQTKVLDGKKTTKIELKGNGGNQQHDVDAALSGFGLLGSTDYFKCKAPEECLRLDFIYKPDNIVGDLLVTAKWQNRQSDMDLYLFNKEGKQVAYCGGPVGTGEFLTVPAAKLTSGEKYTLIVTYYRSFGDDVVATAELPGSKAPTHPAAADIVFHTSCTDHS